MSVLVFVLVIALLIPVLGIVIDSPIGRALARRLEGPDAAPPAVAELAARLATLEGEVQDLSRSVHVLQEENQFLQRLLEGGRGGAAGPPAP
ncbi:MAG: hypothetical protein NW201_00980 [Gemmatimonadales bacterium]|nr:hypothetical protein [Gemmatimonadales bacterium]